MDLYEGSDSQKRNGITITMLQGDLHSHVGPHPLMVLLNQQCYRKCIGFMTCYAFLGNLTSKKAHGSEEEYIAHDTKPADSKLEEISE